MKDVDIEEGPEEYSSSDDEENEVRERLAEPTITVPAFPLFHVLSLVFIVMLTLTSLMVNDYVASRICKTKEEREMALYLTILAWSVGYLVFYVCVHNLNVASAMTATFWTIMFRLFVNNFVL